MVSVWIAIFLCYQPLRRHGCPSLAPAGNVPQENYFTYPLCAAVPFHCWMVVKGLRVPTPLTWYCFIVVMCHAAVVQLGTGVARCQSAGPGVIPLRLGVPAGQQGQLERSAIIFDTYLCCATQLLADYKSDRFQKTSRQSLEKSCSSQAMLHRKG